MNEQITAGTCNGIDLLFPLPDKQNAQILIGAIVLAAELKRQRTDFVQIFIEAHADQIGWRLLLDSESEILDRAQCFDSAVGFNGVVQHAPRLLIRTL